MKIIALHNAFLKLFINLLLPSIFGGQAGGLGCKNKKPILQKGLHIEPVKLIGASCPQPGDLAQWQENDFLRINIPGKAQYTSECCHACQNVTVYNLKQIYVSSLVAPVLMFYRKVQKGSSLYQKSRSKVIFQRLLLIALVSHL